MQLPVGIEINNQIMMGKPCIQGTRIPVYIILQKIAAGESEQQLLAAYPQLNKQHLSACLLYAATLASEEVVTAHA